jgi:hypothetical protein
MVVKGELKKRKIKAHDFTKAILVVVKRLLKEKIIDISLLMRANWV